ncbi:MAG: hypothetical protein MUF66_07360 [Gammaproteobacteria bacterium]|jgi:hypothetical protein|nr:hypothetical protein [Gammaproteobacteria bacterium]
MVTVYDMRAGTWTDDEAQEDDGVGRGGCCRREAASRERRLAAPRLQLGLLPVSTADTATRRFR